MLALINTQQTVHKMCTETQVSLHAICTLLSEHRTDLTFKQNQPSAQVHSHSNMETSVKSWLATGL